MEEGLFPHHMSHDEPGRLEEERRLCYVGMTRAMKKLYLSYGEVRRLHGNENHHRPSRYISEIPKELLDEVRLKTQIVRPTQLRSLKTIRPSRETIGDTGLRLGQQATHPTFGEGVIVDAEGQGGHKRLQVKFNKADTKWLIASFAKLTVRG